MTENYANPAFFYRDFSDEDLPPGVDRATYINPEWNWFDKLCKKLAPHDWKVFAVAYSTLLWFLVPRLWRWYNDEEPPFNSDTDGENERLSKLKPRKPSNTSNMSDSDSDV